MQINTYTNLDQNLIEKTTQQSDTALQLGVYETATMVKRWWSKDYTGDQFSHQNRSAIRTAHQHGSNRPGGTVKLHNALTILPQLKPTNKICQRCQWVGINATQVLDEALARKFTPQGSASCGQVGSMLRWCLRQGVHAIQNITPIICIMPARSFMHGFELTSDFKLQTISPLPKRIFVNNYTSISVYLTCFFAL